MKIEKLIRRYFGKAKSIAGGNPFDRHYYTSEELLKIGLKKIGKDVKIEASVKIINAWNISIGDNVIIDQFAVINGGGGDGLNIGSHIHIAGHCMLSANSSIILEDFVGLSAGSMLISASDNFNGSVMVGPAIPNKYTSSKKAPIILREHTVLGAGTIILPGVECALATATGANAVLRKSTEAFGIYVGDPAKRIATRKNDLIGMGEQFRREYNGQ